MLFNSYVFVAFFAIFMLLYGLLRGSAKAQTFLILVSSYVFYGWWDERFLILIIISTITDYAVTLGLTNHRLTLRQGLTLSAYIVIGSVVLMLPHWGSTAWTLWFVVAYLAAGWILYPYFMRMAEARRKKALLVYILCIDLGVLGVFKYFNFFADSLVHAANSIGWNVDPITLNIVLPVGISFYTFQTIGYCIDVYRGKANSTKDFIRFSAYVTFFPQLVAGPIERGGHLLPQFEVPHTPRWDGAWLFLWGLYKKLVVADNLAPFVNSVFANPGAASGAELIAGILGFTFQIYCDFSGYSDMARGIARMMGFDILVNFNLPYISRTPSEFWQRWHISLSSWLRDYLYISLGGNRKGTLLTYRNLFITMVLGGLWHGAAWTFVLWGAFHGAILVIYRLIGLDDWVAKRKSTGLARQVEDLALVAIMFVLVCFGWLLFRAPDTATVMAFLRGVGRPLGSLDPFGHILFYVAPLLVFEALQGWKRKLAPTDATPLFLRLNVQLFVLLGIALLSATTSQKFIYFNF